ncbi:hypothetical protein GCM10010357_67780 [Streptomyces luteireticuli]|uniref:Uncharacterized protein n=1 Tax=Streptomyces luteireticuli TaxID=173858 RepID=A0ABN0Z704_9ACTN
MSVTFTWTWVKPGLGCPWESTLTTLPETRGGEGLGLVVGGPVGGRVAGGAGGGDVEGPEVVGPARVGEGGGGVGGGGSGDLSIRGSTTPRTPARPAVAHHNRMCGQNRVPGGIGGPGGSPGCMAVPSMWSRHVPRAWA